MSGLWSNFRGREEVLRRELSAAAAEVRFQLPELKRIAKRRFSGDSGDTGPQLARRLEESLAVVEGIVNNPVAWSSLVDWVTQLD